jgi:glycosyltransferase involved in cell wall biosynthesis
MAYFSIIIPLYNKEKHIKDTLNSVLSQTNKNFEIIIVNDGSTDESELEVKSIQDERIKLYTIENHGVSYARNYGVKKASSDFIVLLDADDYWKPHHLENLKKLQQAFPSCGLYAVAYESAFGERNIPSKYHNIPLQQNWMGIVDDFFESSTINCIASSSSVMIPRSVYEEVGGFDTTYNSGEDIDLWIRIALNYDVSFNNNVSVEINMIAENQASQSSINTRNHLNFDVFEDENTNKNLKTYLDLNRFSIAIQHKVAGNHLKAKELINKIDKRNLNAKQRMLLHMNASVLKSLLKIKIFLRKNGIGLSSFR